MTRIDQVLIRTPRTPWRIRLVGVLIALAISAVIVQVVMVFAWYASGLATEKAEQQAREKAPIPVDFAAP